MLKAGIDVSIPAFCYCNFILIFRFRLYTIKLMIRQIKNCSGIVIPQNKIRCSGSNKMLGIKIALSRNESKVERIGETKRNFGFFTKLNRITDNNGKPIKISICHKNSIRSIKHLKNRVMITINKPVQILNNVFLERLTFPDLLLQGIRIRNDRFSIPCGRRFLLRRLHNKWWK